MPSSNSCLPPSPICSGVFRTMLWVPIYWGQFLAFSFLENVLIFLLGDAGFCLCIFFYFILCLWDFFFWLFLSIRWWRYIHTIQSAYAYMHGITIALPIICVPMFLFELWVMSCFLKLTLQAFICWIWLVWCLWFLKGHTGTIVLLILRGKMLCLWYLLFNCRDLILLAGAGHALFSYGCKNLN